VAFVPGEPCVELGLELRRRARNAGYGAQFTVALANDYLGYFVPVEFYSHLHYEAAMNFYGPRIAEWLYEGFDVLTSEKAIEAVSPATPSVPPVQETAGARRVVLQGTAYERGYRRGAAFADEIRDAFEARIQEPLRSGEAIPDDGWWKLAPGFVDLTPLALPRLAIGARPLLEGLSDDAFREIEGMADG